MFSICGSYFCRIFFGCVLQISNVIPNLNDFLCCTCFATKYFLILCCYLKKILRFSYQIIFSLFLFLSICILLSLSYKISSKKCIVSPFTHLQIAGTHSTVGKKIQKKFAGQKKSFCSSTVYCTRDAQSESCWTNIFVKFQTVFC